MPATLEENVKAFTDYKTFVVKNVPRELDGNTFFKARKKFIRTDPILFSVTDDVTL